jgi:hypothetical protein
MLATGISSIRSAVVQPEHPTLPKSQTDSVHLNHLFSTLILISQPLPTPFPALSLLQTRICPRPLRPAASHSPTVPRPMSRHVLPPPRRTPSPAAPRPHSTLPVVAAASPSHHQPNTTGRRSSSTGTLSPAASRRHHDRKGRLAAEVYAGCCS